MNIVDEGACVVDDGVLMVIGECISGVVEEGNIKVVD